MDWGYVAKRLSLGVAAIAMASAVLLLSDLKSRRRNESAANVPAADRVFRIALLQHVSQPSLDEGARGVIAGLEEAGFTEGQNLTVERFNAEGDLATSNAIALQIVNGGYDLAVTVSTLSLQSLANTNRDGKVVHLFALVTDPLAAKVGITGQKPDQHPPHLVGLGTMQPVAESIKMARRFYPGLKKLGVVWNPAEDNSQVNTRLCKEACQTLGIEVQDVNAENTAAVGEATAAVILRGVDALWIGGDLTVLAAVDSLLRPAKAARIPVFTVIPGNADKGTLFDLGANYFEVGRELGNMAGQVLSGTSPATLPVKLVVPAKLCVNTLAARGLRDQWNLPPDILASADEVIDTQGKRKKPVKPIKPKSAPKISGPLTRKWNVRLLQYVNLPDVSEAERGVLDAIREAGIQEGRDFDKLVQNANGEMALLSGLVDAAVTDNADLLITFSTPTLQAAMRRGPTMPTVFTFLADPKAAGAGTSDTEHKPYVTGAYGSGDALGMIALIQKILPRARRIGVLFCPAEVNSVYNRNQVEAAAKQAGLEVVAQGVDTPAEVGDAATALTSQSIDLVCLPTANLTAASFPSIVQATRRAKLPVFAFLGGLAKQGATVTLARDYYDMGHNAGRLAARVMRGESPGKIPFEPSKDNKLILNLEAARQCGLVLPDSLVKSAQVIER